MAFLGKCKELASTDTDDDVRIAALNALARRFSATSDDDVSRFLATLTSASKSRPALCFEAYLSLLEVQFGFTEQVQQQSKVSALLRIDPEKMGTDSAEIRNLCGLLFTSVKELTAIDWQFVRQYLPT
jgi:hypothetical protein